MTSQEIELVSRQVTPANRKKSTAVLLAFFIGTGAHNFYLGRIVRGIIQLYLTVIGSGFVSAMIDRGSSFFAILAAGLLFSLWGYIEIILILTAKPGSKWSLDASGATLV